MRTTAMLLAACAALAAGCTQNSRVPGTPEDKGPDAAADRAKLQGVWAIESLELPNGEKADERVKDVRFVFDGVKFRIAEQGRSYAEQFAYALDTTVKPKVMILTELNDDGTPYRPGTARAGTFRAPATAPRGATAAGAQNPVDRQEWIYKFDGESLVVAFRAGRSSGRPVDFKADNGQPGRTIGATGRAATVRFEPAATPTIVVRLRKTNEAAPPEPNRNFGTARGGYGTRR